MQDCMDVGHMSSLNTVVSTPHLYYIPHHEVFKSPENQNLRVTFDAFAIIVTIHSMTSKLQNDISSILLRFRLLTFVFTCDEGQIYRHILIEENYRLY